MGRKQCENIPEPPGKQQANRPVNTNQIQLPDAGPATESLVWVQEADGSNPSAPTSVLPSDSELPTSAEPTAGIQSGILPGKLPFGLKTADEISPTVGLTPSRIIELAASGHFPHHWFDGEGPFFKQTESTAWVRANITSAAGGLPLPKSLKLIDGEPMRAMPGQIPAEISALDGLMVFPMMPAFPCAIYFLCKRGRVVYVGQSTSLIARVLSHTKCKQFDSVLYLPCPESELDRVEGSFIRVLRPELNGAGPKVEPENIEQVRRMLNRKVGAA